MLLFWIRDHPTQCSIDSFKATNYNACLCDHMGKWVYHHNVIYPNTVYQTKHPMSLWSISSIIQEFTNMHVIMVQNRCITTFSKLWRFYTLYKFNLSWKVSTYTNIKTNKRDNEITYSTYHLQDWFSQLYMYINAISRHVNISMSY
jgi:hypothetical protein